jgi:hypothetical protein
VVGCEGVSGEYLDSASEVNDRMRTARGFACGSFRFSRVVVVFEVYCTTAAVQIRTHSLPSILALFSSCCASVSCTPDHSFYKCLFVSRSVQGV